MIGNREKGLVLQARDYILFHALSIMLFLFREMAQAIAGFGSVTRANTRLLSLHRAGLLNRTLIGTSSGGKKAVYFLSRKGADLIGTSFRSFPGVQSEGAIVSPFINHQLQVNRIHIGVAYRKIPVHGVRFVRWQSFHEPLSKVVPIIPDGFFEVETVQETLSMFLEVDLGTERGEKWPEKIRRYIQLAVTGEFEKLFRHSRFRVLLVVPSERRLSFIRKVILKQTEKVFWLSTFDSIHRDGFWSAIWHRPNGDQKLPLI